MKSAVLAALVLAAAAGPARADDPPPFTIGGQPSWFALAGVTGGATLYDTRGGFVGGEVSVTRLRQGRVVGCYADGYHDFGVDGTYATAGLVLGRRWVGVDGGGAIRFAYGERQLGAVGRIYASVGVFSIYARYGHFFDTDRNDHVVQVGATLKLPIVSPW